MNKLQLIHHFQSHGRSNSPSTDEMLAYPKAFEKVMEEHVQLHKHFKTGHEHNPLTGEVIPDK